MLIQTYPDYKKFLSSLVQILDITPDQFQKAKDHYNAVGGWLAQEDSSLSQYHPEIYPQGSFRLGTVIKPLNGEDEYDIDLVCKIQLTKREATQEELKKMVGNRLKEKEIYKQMLDKEEGRRCWTLNYKETPKFHMDILPAIPDNYDWLLEKNVITDYAEHAICITDKESREYSTLSEKWHNSNPIGYANWFKDQMKIQLRERRKVLAEKRNVSIEEISEDEIKTPLQRAVQILKRHRDIMFGDDEDRPISIIITTLAARAYAEENELFLALKNILERMHTFIRVENGVSIVENPVNPLENFADKWIEYPIREENFRIWMKKAKEDIIDLIEREGFIHSLENLKEVFGKGIVKRSLIESSLNHLDETSPSVVPGLQSLLDVSHRESPNWVMNLTKKVSIAARFKDQNGWHTVTSKTAIPKQKDIQFIARTNVEKPFSVYWQVVNTGEEAKSSGDLRGKIFEARTAGIGGLRHKESTKYSGTHWVECYIVKDGECVARSKELFVKID